MTTDRSGGEDGARAADRDGTADQARTEDRVRRESDKRHGENNKD